MNKRILKKQIKKRWYYYVFDSNIWKIVYWSFDKDSSRQFIFDSLNSSGLSLNLSFDYYLLERNYVFNSLFSKVPSIDFILKDNI